MVTYTTKEMHAHTLAQTLAHPRTHARSHVRTSPRTHACSNTRTKMHTYTRMHARCAPVHFLHAYTLAPIQACAPERCHVRTHVGMHAPTTHARTLVRLRAHARRHVRTNVHTYNACMLTVRLRTVFTHPTHPYMLACPSAVTYAPPFECTRLATHARLCACALMHAATYA